MSIRRRDFLKYCAGSAAVLGLQLSPLPILKKALAAVSPTYPISTDVRTTLERTVRAPLPLPPLGPNATIYPCQISLYTANGYGLWEQNPEGVPAGGGSPYCSIDMNTGSTTTPSFPDPSAAGLLSFFTFSDVHICDKETPAQVIRNGYQYPLPLVNNKPVGEPSSYSGVMLYTTHVLDAAIQTINALHKMAPFDFGIALGDACDNTQHNELRWYLDVIDGGPVSPSSGAHAGASQWNYQKPYVAAGLDKSIKWYQAIGNHDQFFKGSTYWTEHLREIAVGPNILNTGPPTSPPDFRVIMNGRGYLMGVVDGSTEYGDIINVGPTSQYNPLPTVVADPDRYALTISDWMSEFFNTTSEPVGHGFTQGMIDGTELAACYTFKPRTDVPIRVIVLDDTDKLGYGVKGCLDEPRYNWLLNELDSGQAADELMIICAHIPVWPYDYQTPSPYTPACWNPDSVITDYELVNKISSTYSNVVLWAAGHAHRNAITPQPDAGHPGSGYGFWEVETSSLRDFPQGFRCFEIVRNSDDQTISILVVDVDPAVNPAPLPDGTKSPALVSRSYAIAAQEIFEIPIQQNVPGVDPRSGVCNAQLVIHLSQLTSGLQAKIRNMVPTVSSFQINKSSINRVITCNNTVVVLDNTVAGSIPVEYRASESPDFDGAAWQSYSTAPSFTLSSTVGSKTVYFQVRDGSGQTSSVVESSIRVTGSIDSVLYLLMDS